LNWNVLVLVQRPVHLIPLVSLGLHTHQDTLLVDCTECLLVGARSGLVFFIAVLVPVCVLHTLVELANAPAQDSTMTALVVC
jgi:hypothetical protein